MSGGMGGAMSGQPLFSVLDVEKAYEVGRAPPARRFARGEPRLLHALDGVRLDVGDGDAVALVGESGSGKSTLVRLMLGLEAATEGRLLYRGADLGTLLKDVTLSRGGVVPKVEKALEAKKKKRAGKKSSSATPKV